MTIAWIVRCVVAATITLSLMLASAAADDTAVLSPHTYEHLHAAQALLEEGEAAQAITRLKLMLTRLPPNPYEHAIVQQAIAHAYLDREEYASAIAHARQALAGEALPAAVGHDLRYTLAQLYFTTGQYEAAARTLAQWLQSAVEPDTDAYVMLGRAYYELGRYQPTADVLRKAVDSRHDVPEYAYQTLLAAYYELELYDSCSELLKTMIRRFPQRQRYWRQLADMALNRDRPGEALAVMELAYAQGHVDKQDDVVHLAKLFVAMQAPYKAGILLRSEIEQGRVAPDAQHWELLANTWLQARESDKAVAAMERAYALSESSVTGLRLARLYLDNRRRGEAADTVRTLLDDNRLTTVERGRAWLLLGIARFESQAWEEAYAAFEKAQDHSDTYDDAKQWMAYLQRVHLP